MQQVQDVAMSRMATPSLNTISQLEVDKIKLVHVQYHSLTFVEELNSMEAMRSHSKPKSV